MERLSWTHPTEDDHAEVVDAVLHWWEGDQGAERASLLPRLFFQHFGPTSFVVRDHDRIVGFLIGFMSAAHPEQAYIHFVGVHPDERGQGLAREMYERFFALAREHGRSEVHAVTAPVNTGSQRFHRRMGFTLSDPLPDYDGPGQDRVSFHRSLGDRHG